MFSRIPKAIISGFQNLSFDITNKVFNGWNFMIFSVSGVHLHYKALHGRLMVLSDDSEALQLLAEISYCMLATVTFCRHLNKTHAKMAAIRIVQNPFFMKIS